MTPKRRFFIEFVPGDRQVLGVKESFGSGKDVPNFLNDESGFAGLLLVVDAAEIN
jgi:hypothetical protein